MHRRHVAARWLKLDDFVYTWHCLLAEMKVVLVSVDKTLLGPPAVRNESRAQRTVYSGRAARGSAGRALYTEYCTVLRKQCWRT